MSSANSTTSSTVSVVSSIQNNKSASTVKASLYSSTSSSSSSVVISTTSPTQQQHNRHHIFKLFKKKSNHISSPVTEVNTNSNSNSNSNINSDMNGKVDEEKCSFAVGVSEDKNRKCRRTMEDAHTYVYNFGQWEDAGYFAIFDGHAGKGTAEWCSENLHSYVESIINKSEALSLPHILNTAFTEADSQINKLGLQNSGCTAAVAVIRWEDNSHNNNSISEVQKRKRKRMLYVANVGDTRVVLCRSGKPLRLTYDHKGSDPHESKRVANAGGLMINNRVNGVLAVTRSLGDSSMKDLVTGSPFTTETQLEDDDEFMIVACDGLWDVCDDKTAVNLVRNIKDPQEASQVLVDHALQHFSTDNLTCMVIRLDPSVV